MRGKAVDVGCVWSVVGLCAWSRVVLLAGVFSGLLFLLGVPFCWSVVWLVVLVLQFLRVDDQFFDQ